MTSGLPALPRGWHWTSLGEISEKPQYGWTTKADPEKGAVRLLRTTDITSGALDWSSVPFCTDDPDDLEKYLVKSGDIVISRAGSVGFSYLLTHVERAVFASYLIRFRIKPGINKKYVYYYLKSPDYWRAIGSSKVGIAVPNVNAKKLAQVPVPLAPEEQQQRIVAEIEKQFSRLDEAVANLKRVKANLKRYKAAVLKAAVEGKLTEEWRKQHPGVEPASELLKRILAERRTNWKGKGKYKEAVAPDLANLPNLPLGWVWSSVEAICSEVVDCPHSTPKWATSGRVCLRTTEFRPGRLDLRDVRYVSQSTYEKRIQRLQPKANDVVYSREGGILGIACMIPPGLEPCLGQRMMLLRTHSSVISNFLVCWLNSPWILARVRSLTGGSASPHLNVRDVKAFPVPLAPFVEELAVVAQVERSLSVIEDFETSVERNFNRGDSIRQSIQQQAFSGRLRILESSDRHLKASVTEI